MSDKKRVPVYMRIGHGKERQVGWVELVPDQYDINQTRVAELLQAAADELGRHHEQPE